MTTDLDADHRAWLAELTLELRLLDVSGRDIGDAVASAREFLHDSGVPAREAFGDPREYAVALRLAPAPGAAADERRAVAIALVGLLGFFAVAYAGGPAWRRDGLDVDASTLVLLVTTVVLVALAPRYLATVMRAPAWRVVTGMAAVFGLQVLVAWLLGDVAVGTVPALPVALVGAVVLVGSAAANHRNAGRVEDPVTEPIGPTEAPRDLRWVAVLPGWLMCVAALVFVWLDVALAR